MKKYFYRYNFFLITNNYIFEKYNKYLKDFDKPNNKKVLIINLNNRKAIFNKPPLFKSALTLYVEENCNSSINYSDKDNL